MVNFIEDRNPFGLAAPPAWWLLGLHVFDGDLVMIPSRRKAVFVLARRRKFSRAIAQTEAADRKLKTYDPGNVLHTSMCESYGLIYVTTVMSIGAWTQQKLEYLCDELTARDTWAHGGPLSGDQQQTAHSNGGTALAKRVDAFDEAQRARLNREVRDECYHATGDAWRSRQARRGERILNAGQPSRLTRASALAMPQTRHASALITTGV